MRLPADRDPAWLDAGVLLMKSKVWATCKGADADRDQRQKEKCGRFTQVPSLPRSQSHLSSFLERQAPTVTDWRMVVPAGAGEHRSENHCPA